MADALCDYLVLDSVANVQVLEYALVNRLSGLCVEEVVFSTGEYKPVHVCAVVCEVVRV